MTDEERAVLWDALDTWGTEAQVSMVFEEMAELQNAICKYRRGRCTVEDVAEEVADVEIMLEQLKLIFTLEPKVSDYRQEKLRRLAQRLKNFHENAQ